MNQIEQGDIVRVPRARVPFLVISSNLFNQSGLIIVCPVATSAAPDALHVPIQAEHTEGIVLCEDLASISLHSRSCMTTDRIRTGDLMEIIYRVQSIFDYFPHTE